MPRKCPHANIVNCPLYHAMHVAYGPSCASERLDEGLCAVDLGKSYSVLLSELTAKHPLLVAECAWQAPRVAESVH